MATALVRSVQPYQLRVNISTVGRGMRQPLSLRPFLDFVLPIELAVVHPDTGPTARSDMADCTTCGLFI